MAVEQFIPMDVKRPRTSFATKAWFWFFGFLVLALSVLAITFIVLFYTTERRPIIIVENPNKPSTTAPVVATTVTPATSGSLNSTATSTENSAIPAPTATPLIVEYCNTTGCRTAASSLLRSMNFNVDPCDDFYEFACGKWTLDNPMPDDRGRWGVTEIVQVDLAKNLKELLEREATEGETEAERKAKAYYRTCVDEETIEKDGIVPLAEALIEIFPQALNFPFSSGPVPTMAEIFQAIVRGRQNGLQIGLFTAGLGADFDNSRKFMINFDAGALPMDRSFYLKPEANQTEVRAYKRYLIDMYLLFARKMARIYTTEQATAAAESLISFETTLASAMLTAAARRDPTKVRNKMTIEEFATNYTSPLRIEAEDVLNYFKVAWNNSQLNDTITKDTIINVIETAFYKNMTQYVSERVDSEEGRKELAHYLIWSFVRSSIGRLGQEFRNISREFTATVTGISIPPPRWETCVNTVNSEFPTAVGRLYVMEYFTMPTKERLMKMTDYLFEAFKQMIREADWMSNKTMHNALRKAESFAVLAGYDDYIVDDPERLDAEHAGFTPTSSYLKNAFNVARVGVASEATSLLRGITPDTWISGSAIVNAFYAPSLNSITFPAGILQPPFLGADYPDYWNFGAIGMVIGHEITHGFDNQGALFDENGNLTMWWDPQSFNQFTRRATGLVAQYSKFEDMGVQMNGINTLGENVADNGGIKEAFRAYKSFLAQERNGKPEPRLPNLSFDSEQLFFLANAQIWCEDWKLKALESQVRNGAHSPGKFRVIGPMQNFDEFARAFSCPVGSRMNPEVKYGVW